MNVALAATCAGLAAWCSLGTIGFVDAGNRTLARVGLLPPWWWLPVAIVAFYVTVRLLRLSADDASPLFGAAVLLLPWLPIPLPPAAFLWTGPLTIAVWAAVLGGVVHARGSPTSGRWVSGMTRAPLLAAWVALTLYGASARRLAPILPDGDSPHYLILAQSLIKDGDIRIENNHLRGDYLEYSLQAAQPDYLRRGVNGQIYSIHAPGLPAVIAPAMWLFGYPGTVAFLELIAALTTGLVWWMAFLVTGNAGAAWFAWACCALTAPFFFQATEVFPDGVAATCALVGTLPLFLAERDERDRGHTIGLTMWAAAGASLALLPWLQTRLATLAAAAALLLLLRMRRAAEAVAFAALPVVSAAGWFAFFWVVYGTPNPTAPYGALTQSSVSNLARGLPGVLFDQQFGLVPNAPVYGALLFGCLIAALRVRRWSLELLALVVPYVVTVAMYQHWWGGASAPARLLTPLAPVMALGGARLWAGARPATRVFHAMALGLSVFVAALLWIPDEGRLLINFRDGTALWLEWAHDVLALSRALPSLFIDTPSRAMVKAAVWAATALVMCVALQLCVGSRGTGDSRRPLPAWLAIWILAVLPMISLSVAWRIDRVSPITTSRSQLGLLRTLATRERWAADYTSRRVIRGDELRGRLAVQSDEQRPRPSPTHILSATAVPPGTYRVHLDARPGAIGTATLRVGDTALPFLRTRIAAADEHAPANVTVSFPVGVRSLIVDLDAAALRFQPSARLLPLAPLGTLDVVRGSARRAARYASADAFFLDDNAYPEPTGFWVAGGRVARAVVAPAGQQLTLFLRNAPVDNVITVNVDGQRQELSMTPREERDVTWARPARGRSAAIVVTSRSGFRPSQVEPGNRDLRYLGCWIEFRDPSEK